MTVHQTAQELTYMTGFGNEFATEALPGALPDGQNAPQRCAYGLYAEQLSGSPFTAPRGENVRSWLYRIRPTVKHVGAFQEVAMPHWRSAPHVDVHALPIAPLRWSPVPIPDEPLSFVDGVRTMTTAGDVHTQVGMAAHLLFVTAPMEDAYFYNADAELLIVPQQGTLAFDTEMGRLTVSPGEIAVLPRGVTFRCAPVGGPVRAYMAENYGLRLTLPERGPIGANGLANQRDFRTPVAWFEDREVPSTLTVKWGGRLYTCEIAQSPLDVVAWHGNYAPYVYDLRLFNTIGSISYDHPDPSIFTVLTAPSGHAGTANIDFVIFPDRWMVAENTFRPPYYHMNVMSEFMGLIYGEYDAKPEGFLPGGMSLHNAMLPHGPDRDAFDLASAGDLVPRKLAGTLAFMFETRLPQHLTAYAASLDTRQAGYADCWAGLEKHFNGTR